MHGVAPVYGKEEEINSLYGHIVLANIFIRYSRTSTISIVILRPDIVVNDINLPGFVDTSYHQGRKHYRGYLLNP